MTCTSNTKAYIKIGDSFDVPVQMVDCNIQDENRR